MTNTERFTGRSDVYVAFRERYEANLILDRLRSWCGLDPAWLVADVGAGTGMLADVFLRNGNRVLAIEPNAEMRSACAAEHPREPRLQVLPGTAEATGLESGSVDCVAVGRAFHWFDFDNAVAEFRRILRPGGWLAVVACGRADSVREENVAFAELIGRHGKADVGVRAGYAQYRRLPGLFETGTYHHEVTFGQERFTWDRLRGYALSISYAPLPHDPRFPAFLRELEDVFERFAVNGVFTLATRHWINAGRWPSQAAADAL